MTLRMSLGSRDQAWESLKSMEKRRAPLSFLSNARSIIKWGLGSKLAKGMSPNTPGAGHVRELGHRKPGQSKVG